MTPPRPGSVLVTGGSGFLGSHLVRRLVHDGREVHLLTRADSDFWRLQDVLPRVQCHAGSLENPASLHAAVASAAPELVFHLASATVVAGSSAASRELVGVNLGGTVNLIEACSAVDYRGLVIAGDSFEYAASQSPLREASCARPVNLHGITKLASTLYAQAVAEAQHKPIAILRLFSTYGPFDHPRRLIPRAIAGALAGTPLLLSRPGIIRDWVYVDDMVALLIEAAQNAGRLAGGVFNAGSGIAVDLGTVVDEILRLTGSRTEVKWGAFPAPEHDAYPWVADTSRTYAAFSWRPKTSLEDGLLATIQWMRSSPPA